MARFPALKVAFVALLVTMLLVAHHNTEATVTCEQVTIWLTPCISYDVLGGVVPPPCCQGLKALEATAKTTEDRRTKCNCIKDGAEKIPGLDYPGLDYDRVNKLPGICGTNCSFTLTHDLDCSKAIRTKMRIPPKPSQKLVAIVDI